ncbi:MULTISPECIES: VOC family protein [unclassified Novosphingobium]|uniref:VOC family protein n=1 Tax=unclassified Novosphingobium TaxID=2644732 RepID=UPI001494C5FE|nr:MULTISPECIES: VOC family protein [unclassified Novosphingobium]MBB3357085.1 putative enzyme related to lactoylglutathione lyase [Novosphingobium sp. BK256]MBB3373486.1 putative enzyme related to lactoylglutathione lyase [Novosphingobium sp. BK280]MBB3377856.1 putative enzyme related to lactoylglutathione lyase [Novosphingobium sp. BK258]MBB3418734.1 putative enzyme related to lactoylglutathione lyase [Novosphingobium sp. BK267]MBB3450431.1 putative enzyme related to lactoylglutathione lyase
MPNTLIFVDMPADDPAAAARFYAEVFGWQNDEKPAEVYHRMVPGGQFKNPDGSDSAIGNLHLGIFAAANARPHPEPAGVAPRDLASDGRKPRIWILISDDDSADRILAAAEERGATILWRNHYWSTFNGYNHAFQDPWGNEILLWGKAGADPQVPADFTRE